MSKAKRRKKRNRKRHRQSIHHGSQSAPLSPTKTAVDDSAWEPPSGSLGRYIHAETQRTLNAYHDQPNLVARDANQEHDTARGGYAHRQLLELIQNSADALMGSTGGHICLKLTETHLYCADNGQAISQGGVRALMFSHLSPKRGTTEIGRYGLGFKAMLGVSDSPEFFSRSGSFRFSQTEAENLIRSFTPNFDRYPILCTPFPMDPRPEMEQDPHLDKFMRWATNIVRLPLITGGHEDLENQFETFRAEFLLLANHVSHISLQKADTDERLIRVRCDGGYHTLIDGAQESRWILFSQDHQLSDEAKNDSRGLDDTADVQIVWAAPLERLHLPGEFWAFFPTSNSSLLAGILNAPWKTNEDRQNLLPGAYNEELIDAAAKLVATSLPNLSYSQDPGCHLDALPRRREGGDNAHSIRLREQINRLLVDREILPDQRGTLRKLDELNFPPSSQEVSSEALETWGMFEHRPDNWLHHSASSSNRWAAIERLGSHRVQRAKVSKWLEQLVQATQGQAQQIEASKAAIQLASRIREYRKGLHQPIPHFGDIVLRNDGEWTPSNSEHLFLSGKQAALAHSVHPELEQCPRTLAALKNLGVKTYSLDLIFKKTVYSILNSVESQIKISSWPAEFKDDDSLASSYKRLWIVSRDLPPEKAATIIKAACLERRYKWYRTKFHWQDVMLVRVESGTWHRLTEVLLPGEIVPGNGSRDQDVTIDTDFHHDDTELLKELGVGSIPVSNYTLPLFHYGTWLFRWQDTCRTEYTRQSRTQIPSTPMPEYLVFKSEVGPGPLAPLETLSAEGRARYTWMLLELETTYQKWVMHHETRNIYPEISFPSPTIAMLRELGMVQTTTGIAMLKDGLGESPVNSEVTNILMSHPKSSKIRRAFNLQFDLFAGIEPVGDEIEMPLVDVWPGLEQFLTSEEMELQLVRCQEFRRTQGATAKVDLHCIRVGNILYLAQHADEAEELTSVLDELDKPLDILNPVLVGSDVSSGSIAEAISKYSTDEERLCAAVGLGNLKRLLPESLPQMLVKQQGSTSGIDIAKAAIAKFHTGALEAYKAYLHDDLHPPSQWAGSARAVRFVQALGFDEEWAGQRSTDRDSFHEVFGPQTLPRLHDYQRKAVQNVRELVSANSSGPHRGLLSMPTGSGKTRVAVQALVEAMREGELQGGVLWVADRDELCQQAVEAWQEVWASKGERGAVLKISRLWGGVSGINQPPPTNKRHVVVATIQTLKSRFEKKSHVYQFLEAFPLIVIDEAHRSIAPSYTSVLQAMGLTRRFRDREPTLIGLTATPYRTNKEETSRLRSRYGAKRLDHGIFPTQNSEAVVRLLQADNVLAKAEHAIIDGGEFDLSDAERREIERNPYWLPQSVEDQIAQDNTRTQRILDAYRNKVDPNWPTIIFATSVAHAEVLAGLLNADGIDARAVSGNTKTSFRHQMVQEFRAGRINVLVNYGIFREGFDAPKTRAIIVARPVFSPNLYFQMIGRGLRGEKNGGNERCLILNVSDNIRNFGLDLAFTELDWLWAT